MKIPVIALTLCLGSIAQAQSPDTGLKDARDHLDKIDEFIATKRSNLVTNGATNGIFGRPQNPKKARVEKKTRVAAIEKPKAQLPLQKIVDALPVTLVDPVHDRVVLSGAPPLRVGEKLELAYEGRKVILKFEGSRSQGAYFREEMSKKLALHKMTRLPKGIALGNKSQKGSDAIRKIDLNQGSQTIKVDLNMAKTR